MVGKKVLLRSDGWQIYEEEGRVKYFEYRGEKIKVKEVRLSTSFLMTCDDKVHIMTSVADLEDLAGWGTGKEIEISVFLGLSAILVYYGEDTHVFIDVIDEKNKLDVVAKICSITLTIGAEMYPIRG